MGRPRFPSTKAKAGPTWNAMPNLRVSLWYWYRRPFLGSGFRRSDGGNFPGFCSILDPVLFVGTRCYREFLHVAAGRRPTLIPRHNSPGTLCPYSIFLSHPVKMCKVQLRGYPFLSGGVDRD